MNNKFKEELGDILGFNKFLSIILYPIIRCFFYKTYKSKFNLID